MVQNQITLHASESVPYVIIAASGYGLDRLLRLVKTRFARAHLTPLPSLGMTKIEIPTLNAGWRAGQHVRIRVLSTGMGLLGWSEVHPFTIASVCKVCFDLPTTVCLLKSEIISCYPTPLSRAYRTLTTRVSC